MVNYSVDFERQILHTASQKHSLDALLVIAAHHGGVVQITFLRRLLLGQDVTVIGVLPFDFTRARESKTLLGTGFGFQCRHYFTVFFEV